MKYQLLFFLMTAGLLFSACETEELILAEPLAEESIETNGGASGLSDFLSIFGEEPCGSPVKYDLLAGQNILIGGVRLVNSDEYLFVNYETSGGWVMETTHLYAGDCATIPTNQGGNPQIGQFPYQTDHQPYVSTFTYAIPLEDLDDCFCVAAHASVHLLDADGNILQSETAWPDALPFGGGSWATYLEFCEVSCDDDPPALVCDGGPLRTQTQGGWGAKPNGNNPGVYLHANFAGAFPDGLTIGCDYTLYFETAQGVTDFLPAGGTPSALDQDYVNPTEAISVFAGQVTALAVSLGMDAYDPEFGASDFPLAEMVVATGDFAGWTVGAVFSLAQEVLGGCNMDYTPSELNDVVSSINENYVDGDSDGGYLECPE